jgi:hypothetical protein
MQIRLSPLRSDDQRRLHRLQCHRSSPVRPCVVDDDQLSVHQRRFTDAENPADRLHGIFIGCAPLDDLIEDIPMPAAIAPER